MARNLLERKVNGAIKAEQTAKITNPNTNKTNEKSKSKQGPSIHVDPEALEEIKILERMLKLKHHNETIRLLIDFYINNQSAERQKQFQTIKQIEQQM